MASVINQIKIGNIEYAIAASAYAECATAAGTAAKTANISTDNDTTNNAFTLVKGVSVQVKFTTTNTATNPTLNINSTGAKAIYYEGKAIPASYLKGSYVYTFVYNGTQWDLVGQNYSLPNAGTSLGGVKSGGDVTISEGVITVNDDSHSHIIGNIDGLQTALDEIRASIGQGGTALISHGTADPSADTTTQYYFKI
jgi:hypothetical protein